MEKAQVFYSCQLPCFIYRNQPFVYYLSLQGNYYLQSATMLILTKPTSIIVAITSARYSHNIWPPLNP